MKKISVVLVSLVYVLPGVLAVLSHTHVLDKNIEPANHTLSDTHAAVVDSAGTFSSEEYLVFNATYSDRINGSGNLPVGRN